MFQPDKFYYSLLNRESVQGSILERRELNLSDWYEVETLEPLTLVVPQLPTPLEIPQDVDPLLFVKLAVNKHLIFTGQVNRRKKSRVNSSKRKNANYAEMVVSR